MTIPYPYNDYVTNGTQVKFDFSFEIQTADQLIVYYTPEGDEFEPTIQVVTNYTTEIAVLPLLGGSITFDVAPDANGTLVIERNIPLEINTSFSDVTTFNGSALDTVFHKIGLMLQQISFSANQQALHYPPNAPDLDDLITQVGVLQDGFFWKRQGNAIIGTKLEENPNWSTLRNDLLSKAEGGDGQSIVGFYNQYTPANNTGHKALDELYQRVIALEQGNAGVGSLKLTHEHGNIEGYLLLTTGTIGDTASNATVRANTDMENLFKFYWAHPEFAKWLAIYNSDGSLGTKGATSEDDWAANKAIRLPEVAGLSIVAAQNGNENGVGCKFTADHTTDELTLEFGTQTVPTAVFTFGRRVRLSSPSGSLPAGLSSSTTYFVFVVNNTKIKLATSADNLLAGTYVDFTSNGSGDMFIKWYSPYITSLLGVGGFEEILQTGDQVGPHDHADSAFGGSIGVSDAGGANAAPDWNQSKKDTPNVGGSFMPCLSPYAGVNVYVKK